MDFKPLAIEGAWDVRPRVHGDSRGQFLEWFRADSVAQATGHEFALAQANLSLSAAGTLRGIHFGDRHLRQAKYVTVPHGSIDDYIVDVREGSPTFGHWDVVRVTAEQRNAVFIDAGLGHAFVALEDATAVAYLTTAVYSPQHEFAVDPFDVDISLDFELSRDRLLLSERDQAAPSLAEARALGILPVFSREGA